MKFELILLFALASSSFAQVIFDRNCPERPVESHFNLEQVNRNQFEIAL
jgi:hypothetical protein